MFKLTNSLNINNVKIKYLLIVLLILTSLFLAFNQYPPILGIFEVVEIYRDFIPTHNPPLVFSISEDPTTNGQFNTFGYVAVKLSRYVSNYLGHNLSNVRLPSIIYGLIALFLLYVIVNRWYGWKVALVSTFLLATNQYFLIFQHSLLIFMATLTSILFCIERFQNLLTKNNKFSILSFGFACALTTLHYWTGRWVMLCVLFFYLVDFEKFSIWKYKSYLYFTNLQRIKTLSLVFISMVLILTIFYPGNLLLLFRPDFIYPSLRVGEFSDIASQTLYNIWHNLEYYFKYYIVNRANHPIDIISLIPHPVENIIILALSFLGIIILLVKKVFYPQLFLLYILFVTFFPPLFSATTGNTIHISSSSLHAGRVIFAIPFMCIMAVLGFRYIYAYTINRNYSLRLVFVFLISLFFCIRIYGYFNEIERFNTYINSYKIDFSQPAKNQKINIQTNKEAHKFALDRRQLPRLRLDEQIYYYRVTQFISNHLITFTSNSNSVNLLYIPEEIYAPFISTIAGLPGGGIKGYPYYFPMHLTFYLQEEGLNVSYLVKKEDIKETFLKKVLKVVDRYNLGKNIDSGDRLSDGHYPRNKTQEEIVKMFVVIIDWIESYKMGKKWLNSIREQTSHYSNISPIGDYFINITSNKIPDYLIITSKEELDYVQKKTDYALVLSLPLL